jgi:hypothetical protein
MSVFGTEYKFGQYCLMHGSKMNSPIFGKIVTLLCSDSDSDGFLICQKTTNTYCREMDLFYVNDENEYVLIPVNNLAAFHPLESYIVTEALKNSISLRHYVVENLII